MQKVSAQLTLALWHTQQTLKKYLCRKLLLLLLPLLFDYPQISLKLLGEVD